MVFTAPLLQALFLQRETHDTGPRENATKGEPFPALPGPGPPRRAVGNTGNHPPVQSSHEIT